MQGNKQYEETLFLSFQLSQKVPEDNFYRRLKQTLDLSFVRKQTRKYYGSEGQSSIDPVVFFKLMLIGYIENIASDRKIIEQASMRMDMLFFLGYNIDESLPWHSTLSRTRQLYGEELFLEVFRKILSMCVSKGMVEGSRQAVDSAFIKAHASMDSMSVHMGIEAKGYYQQLSENEEKESQPEKESREENMSGHTHPAPKKGKPNNINRIYSSSTDPDARIMMKKSTKRDLYYYGQISVDTSSHVICGAIADFADQRDAQCLPALLEHTETNLEHHGLAVEELLADTGYSSGSSLQYLEEKGIDAYIPNVANYLPVREGFTYVKEGDYYLCRLGAKLPFKRIHTDKRDQSQYKLYDSSRKDCRKCPHKSSCIKSASYKHKHLEDTLYKPYYDRMHEKMKSVKGKRMRNLRSSTVEPVLGTLLQFRRMRKVYTKGIVLANKHVLLAASAYNLKKLLAFTAPKNKNAVIATTKVMKTSLSKHLPDFFVCLN
jgi:transposase